MAKKRVKCVVVAADSNGSPGFFPVIVVCSKRAFTYGDHFDMAKEAADEAGWGTESAVVFDEDDTPKWLSEQFDWTTTKVC